MLSSFYAAKASTETSGGHTQALWGEFAFIVNTRHTQRDNLWVRSHAGLVNYHAVYLLEQSGACFTV